MYSPDLRLSRASLYIEHVPVAQNSNPSTRPLNHSHTPYGSRLHRRPPADLLALVVLLPRPVAPGLWRASGCASTYKVIPSRLLRTYLTVGKG